MLTEVVRYGSSLSWHCPRQPGTKYLGRETDRIERIQSGYRLKFATASTRFFQWCSFSPCHPFNVGDGQFVHAKGAVRVPFEHFQGANSGTETFFVPAATKKLDRPHSQN